VEYLHSVIIWLGGNTWYKLDSEKFSIVVDDRNGTTLDVAVRPSVGLSVCPSVCGTGS